MNTDQQITEMKAKLQSLKRQRQEASEQFVEEQAAIFERQFFASQCLEKLHQKVSITSHIHAIQEQSCFDDSPYIIAKEAALCRALHMVEVKTNELRVLVQQHSDIVGHMEETRDMQERTHKDNESELLRSVRFVSIDMAGIVVENQESLKRQRQRIYQLGGGQISSMLGDLPCDESTVSSSDSSASSSFAESFSSLFKPRQNRRRSMEKRITKVSSYFGVFQTAQAA
jgi:hypothetical protein